MQEGGTMQEWNGGACYGFRLEAWGDLFPGAWQTPADALAAGRQVVQRNSLPNDRGAIVRYMAAVDTATGRVTLDIAAIQPVDFLTADPATLEA